MCSSGLRKPAVCTDAPGPRQLEYAVVNVAFLGSLVLQMLFHARILQRLLEVVRKRVLRHVLVDQFMTVRCR
jgi:hypothetical protein